MYLFISRELVGVVNYVFFDFGMESWYVLIVEWNFVIDKYIKDDVEILYIDFWFSVSFSLEKFRCGKV